MKVAWFGHQPEAPSGDGLATYSREMVRGLRARGIEVLFVHHSDRPACSEHEVALGALARAGPVVIPQPRTKQRIAALLREQEVDLVHVSLSFSALDFQLPALCHALDIPAVATFHVGYDARFSIWTGLHAAVHRVYAHALAGFDRVITFSLVQREALRRFGVPPRVLAVIPNAVAVDRYTPAARCLDEAVIMYSGRLDADKNLDALCEVVFAWERPGAPRLYLIGDGSDAARLRRRFRHPRITFVGWVPDEAERIALLQRGAIFALPSRVEGVSLAMLEAMACGLAVVATDVGGHREALGGSGLLLDPRHLEPQLRLAFEVLLTFPEFRKELGRRARARAVRCYGLGTNLDALLDLYRQILQGKPLSGVQVRTQSGGL